MKRTRRFYAAGLVVLVFGAGLLVPNAIAAEDDFNNIVHRIEVEYHVHHNLGFLMGFAGFMGKVSHFAGGKGFKAAIFEDQYLFDSESSAKLDEIMRSVGKSGWEPLIKNFSRRTGERNYIYAQVRNKDMKVLLVTVEPDEAVVLQVELDPDKVSDFIQQHTKKSGD